MDKKYDPKVLEPKTQKFWEKEKIYKFNPNSKKKIYSIDTPPPTVSGRMHIGHAFSFSQQDFIARFKRMNNFNVFYPFGTDDNGLPTKLLVEKEKNVRSQDMDRKEFVKLCLKTLKEELRPKYIKDWKNIGMSCDFELYYSTINEHCQKISQESFIDLYNQGREYLALSPAMYCANCKTAISQVELEDKEVSSSFNDIIFKVDNENDLIISTTRPELLPACVAVFFNPEDKRYQSLKGKTAKVPLFDFEVPILSDKKADPEKGTGLVMCCTFGDSVDVEWQKAHKLPIKEAITKDGLMSDLAKRYEGMTVDNARKEIINDLKQANLLVNQKPIQHVVNTHERCGTPIEFINSKQWFVKYLDLKKDMLKWGKKLNWYPAHMKNRYDNWVKGLQWDWCISRQIPFGIPFPVWYCKSCNEIILANKKDLPVDPTSDKPPVKSCPKCKSNEFIPETDIINTWATSSLTPQIAASLVPKLYSKIYPMSLRPQAHDIITFWLFNTVVKSQLHNKKNPWSDVIISGWVLDPKGRKMSKSKGNTIEPHEMIGKYSADALRFLAAGSKLGEDVPFQEKDMVTGTKFINKIWNSSRFVIQNIGDYNKSKIVSAFDKWVLIKLNKLIKFNTDQFKRYEYAQVRLKTEDFFWHTFCDDYLEIVKDRVYNPKTRGKKESDSAKTTLYRVLLDSLKMIAPIMPYVTENVYQGYFKNYEKRKSIHLTDWPKSRDIDFKLEKQGDKAVEIIHKVRQIKSENQKSMKASIILTLNKKLEKDLKEFLDDLKAVTSAEDIVFGSKFSVEFVKD